MKEKTLVSTLTLIASLSSYWYAKETGKDSTPYLMVGGFMGAVIGEVIYEKTKTKKNEPKKN